jgi:magnesium transporter
MNSVQFPGPPSLSSSSSSSSGGLPFSNLVQTIERAIGRWARRGRTDGNSSSSSSNSSSSSSSTSSASSRSPTRRRGRKRSSSIQSHTTSLMTRRQLRQASRIVPREFVLFLPLEHGMTSRPPSSTLGGVAHLNEGDRILHTTSLKLVLGQLGTALKRNAKTQRPPRPAFTTASQNGTLRHTRVSLPSTSGKRSTTANDVPRVAFDVGLSAARSPRDRRHAIDHKKAKGKQWEAPRQIFWQEQMHTAAGVNGSQRAWWLDVASPTWDDMRSLGKVSRPVANSALGL